MSAGNGLKGIEKIVVWGKQTKQRNLSPGCQFSYLFMHLIYNCLYMFL